MQYHGLCGVYRLELTNQKQALEQLAISDTGNWGHGHIWDDEIQLALIEEDNDGGFVEHPGNKVQIPVDRDESWAACSISCYPRKQ